LPLPSRLPRRRPVQADAPASPARPAPASTARFRPGQTTSQSWTRWATTPTLAIPAMRLPAPPPPSRPHPGRTPRMRNPRTSDAHAGHRTPGRSDARTGRWTAVAWTGTRGHCPHRTPDAGRRTLAEDTDTVMKARPASAPPGPPRPAAARWATQPCCCGQRLRRSATTTARQWATCRCETAPRTTASCSVAPRLGRASAHCCRVLDLDGTRGGQWDYGKVRACGVGLVRVSVLVGCWSGLGCGQMCR
jgi:hypothetical protein